MLSRFIRCRRRYGLRAQGWWLGLSSEVGRLPVRPPALAKVLDHPFGLFVSDLYEFVSKVAPLPFGNHRCGLPAEVLPQGLIGRTVVMLQPSREAVGVIDCPVLSDDCVVGDLVRHLEPL